MKSRNLDETKDHIFRVYGAQQRNLATRSLSSVEERRAYMRIYYSDFLRVFDAYMQTNAPCVDEIFSPECDEEFNHFTLQIGAYLIACIQSLHSIQDIAAHAIFYALALDQGTQLGEKGINLTTVTKEIERISGSESLKSAVACIKDSDGHLSALVNHSKHRGLIRPAVSWDGTIVIPQFIYNKKPFPMVPAKTFLAGEFDRTTIALGNIGAELNELLAQLPSKLTPNQVVT